VACERLHWKSEVLVNHDCGNHDRRDVRAAVSLARPTAVVTWSPFQSPCRPLPWVRTIGVGIGNLVILVHRQTSSWNSVNCV